jgi:ribosomal protein L20
MNLGLNRKSLAEMAVRDPQGFAAIAQKAAQQTQA